MVDQVTIRRARPADLARIVGIEVESFPDPWDYHVFEETLSCFPTTFFVAVSAGEVVGFIAGGLEDTGEEIYGHICNLAVTGAFRKQGVGRMLVKREEQQFALHMGTGVQLEVRVSNRKAQKFYRDLGYQEALRVDSYYTNGEDAIVMMKWFRF
jgi:ribosomal-protein-alanine N-acetyltransferase